MKFLKTKITRCRQRLERWRLRRCWLKEMWRQGVSVHKSIELTGRAEVVPWLKFGTGSVIERDCTIWCAAETESEPAVTIGDNVFVGRNTYLGAWKPISIGSDTLIGAYCYIISGNHRFATRDLPVRAQGREPLLGRTVRQLLRQRSGVWNSAWAAAERSRFGAT